MSGRLFSAAIGAGLLAATLGVSGCSGLDGLNPFRERETPLPGQRRPVFPDGHPYAGPQQSEIPGAHAAPETPTPAQPGS